MHKIPINSTYRGGDITKNLNFWGKIYGSSVVVLCVFLSTSFFLKEHSAPPNLTLKNISYQRNKIEIFLSPDSLTVEPAFEFGTLSQNEYFLDLDKIKNEATDEMLFKFGSLKKIEKEQLASEKTRLTFTFHSLQHTPEVFFINNPARIEIHFNRYLENKFVVVIDPGHGGVRPGAVGAGGTIEKNVTLDIAKHLQKYLSERKDTEVLMTRDSDVDIELHDRRRFSDFWEADLFISIHTNSSPDSNINQTEIYYPSNRRSRYRTTTDNSILKQSIYLATTIKDELENVLPEGKVILKRRGFAVIRSNRARLGSVLVETMYLSNPQGEKMLKSKEYQDVIAKGLYNAINNILNEAH